MRDLSSKRMYLNQPLTLPSTMPPIKCFWQATNNRSTGNTVTTAPAIINAIHDAIGVRSRQLPATPDQVIAELGGLSKAEVCPK